MRLLCVFISLCLIAIFCLTNYATCRTEPLAKVTAAGLNIYAENCSICHQMDGSGMPGAQPALTNDDIVTGDPGRLVGVLLRGAGELPLSRRLGYYNVMPAFDSLDDREIAEVLTYVRSTWGHQSSPITAEQVRARRIMELAAQDSVRLR